MKGTLVFILLVAVFATPNASFANPILEGYFNELKFNANGWILEMHVMQNITLDGWYLKSRSGTAYFKNGITLGSGMYVLITRDSLFTSLSVNSNEDSLTLHSPLGIRAVLTWSNWQAAMISAPIHGESICLKETGSFYYLDNTPTLGLPNDDAFGHVRGTVRNAGGSPVSGVQVWYEQWPGRYVYTDSAGRFEFTDHARCDYLQLIHPGYRTQTRTVQIWPESTVSLSFTLELLLEIHGTPPDMPKEFRLYQNYPNPFNPTTTITYQLPTMSHVTLKVFDVLGSELATLVHEVQDSGFKSVQFDASGLASGVYIYQLKTETFIDAKRMIFIN